MVANVRFEPGCEGGPQSLYFDGSDVGLTTTDEALDVFKPFVDFSMLGYKGPVKAIDLIK